MTRTITKTVKKYGNSGGAYVPADWIGGRVEIRLVDEPFDPKRLLSKMPLEHVVSAFLYGSRARGEIYEGSDIDIVVVTDEDGSSLPRETKNRHDIQLMTVKQIRNAMIHDPMFHKSVMDDSVALINHMFLDEIKNEKLEPKGISARIKLAESSLGITKTLFESGEHAELVYPAVMRLKEMLILECLLEKKRYTTELLLKEIRGSGLRAKDVQKIMDVYRSARDGKPTKEKFSADIVGKLISALEVKIEHVRKKTREKGH